MGATGSNGSHYFSPGLAMLPYLDYNYSDLLPFVDLVVHHGKL